MPITFDIRIDWNNDGDYDDTGENVTTRVLSRSGISIQYGRDQGRALSPIAPGRASFELDNRSRDYSPENGSSPLAGYVLPARPVRIKCATLTNLMTNPSFEVDASGWASGGGWNSTVTRTTSEAYSGSASLSMTADASDDMRTSNDGGAGNIAVTAGLSYALSCYFKAATTSRSVRAEIIWFDAGHGYLAQDTHGTAVADSTGGWTRATAVGVAPVGAAWVRIDLRVIAAAAGEVHYMDAVLFEQASSASTYFDGDSLGARWTGTAHNSTSELYYQTLFRGFTDDFDVLPSISERSVSLTCLDGLARLRDVTVSTALYSAITTGQAVGYLLDEIGWPVADRDLDRGATTIPWWWEENTDAYAALEKLVQSEGPPAIAYIDADGRFVFRDRHHRLTRSASTTSQATFRDDGSEPLFSAPLVYDHGWRDVVNSVTFSVEERGPAPELTAVWTSDATISVADGETKLIHAEGSDPFTGAVTPVAGTDYTLSSGTVTVSLSRTTGQSATIFIQATGGPAVLAGMALRGYPITVARTVQVHAEEPTSIGRYGRRSYPQSAPWANANDATAIAGIILAQYAERLPIVSLRMVNGNDTRWAHMVDRDLSDRVTIVDAETGLNDAFYIERIEHRISEAGLFHETTFGCEKVATVPSDVFRFDVAGVGFDDGVFGAAGIDDPGNIFRFDTAGQGFDDGVFAH